MTRDPSRRTRRTFLGGVALGAAAFTARGAFAEELARTPRMTEGPFYPNKLPLDTDNDLIRINDKITPAVGEITHLSGRILGPSGEPLRDVQVEIWQVDAKAVYIHTADSDGKDRDTNFQGFGKFLTGSTGEFYFRTIKPIPYPGRTPHIHVKLLRNGRELLTTQFYVKGHEQNAGDMIYRSIRDPRARDLVSLDFAPISGSKLGELSARTDVVLGFTPKA